jgi:hypothetical protein
MKTKGKCIGCESIKLVNSLGLCKRCNRHAHDFISGEEMTRIKREREMLLQSKVAKKVKEDEEPIEGAAEEEGEEETSEEPGKDSEEGTDTSTD